MRWHMIVQGKSSKLIRIPVVATYAYELVQLIYPLRGLPLRVQTVARGGSGDLVDSARFQVNSAHLQFHNFHVDAWVRSWEPKLSDGDKRRKTLEKLFILHTRKDEAAYIAAQKKCEQVTRKATIVTTDLSVCILFDQDDLIANGPEIIVP